MKKKYRAERCVKEGDLPWEWAVYYANKEGDLPWEWAVYYANGDSVGVFPTRSLARMWAKYLNQLEDSR